MVAGEIPGFLETVRLALRLNPTIYTTLPGTAQGLTYAITIVLLASISESLGQSVVLFLNRVRPRRFVLALSITTLSNVAGYLLWTLTIWSVGNLLAETNQPWSVVAVIVGLAYAPQILAFFELTPYLGNLIWGILFVEHDRNRRSIALRLGHGDMAGSAHLRAGLDRHPERAAHHRPADPAPAKAAATPRCRRPARGGPK
ncbi:MAG: hypothetical protein KDE23_14335 [Caldilinea sp.]|nr:hypothetical protein [Caldilinea sp.]